MYIIQWRAKSGSWINGHAYTSKLRAEKELAKSIKQFKSFEFRIIQI